MKVLFWIPPWVAHGDPLFYKNCLSKHLIPQANLLANAGLSVDLVLPELLASERSLVSPRINVIELDAVESILMTGGTIDPSTSLYLGNDLALEERIEARLLTLLAKSYDCILLWETPVPFLERMYSDALIIHQMPGAFSRAPFPHTVTFDPVGLYKRGALYKFAADITAGKLGAGHGLVRKFVSEARSSIANLQPFDRDSLDPNRRFSKLVLVPLQVSAHYSFQADTSYRTQADFLLHVLSQTEEDTGIVATQYVTPNVRDTVLNPGLVAALKKKWPNLIFRSEFDTVSSVSQYLIPLVDEVHTCSSSIGLQSMIWGRSLRVQQPTFLAPYATADLQLTSPQASELHSNTLSFVLDRHQPLARKVVEDSKFLIGLLEEMRARKRAGAEGLDALPAFESIDPNYSEVVLESFATERAARDLGRVNERWSARQGDVVKFRRAIKAPDIKAVSFDVFDTLIKRPTEVPADVYRFLEQRALNLSDGLAEDFAKVRLNAEVQTRERSSSGEITLDQIYSAVACHYGFADGLTERLKQMEIDAELEFIQVRNEGRKLWAQALSTNLPIYIISDMYLPHAVVESMLAKAGYTEHRKLFVSSSYGVRKKEGPLFDVVLSDLKLKPFELLHVGDNKVSDVEQAEQRGIKTYRLVRALDRMRGNEAYKQIYPAKSGVGEKARSVLAGLTAQTLFDSPSGTLEKQTHFQGNAFNLGYAGLGPIGAGFMLWLGRQAKRDGVTRLYFLSREGWLLKQIYDALHAGIADAVPSTYLYASRRATRVASLRTAGDVLALAGQPYRDGVEVGVLVGNRFGLAMCDEVAAAISAAGYADVTERLSADQEGRFRFASLCSRLAQTILESAKDERSAYLEYLQQTDFISEERAAVVDVGWRANMQGALGQLVGKPLDGYYYATLQGAEAWIAQGHRLYSYAGDLVSVHHPSAVVSNRHLMEFLVCHVEPSLVRMRRAANGFKPVFRPEDDIGQRRLLIEAVHHGAIRLADDMRAEYGPWLAGIWIDPFLAERAFASFVKSPSKADAALLVGHYFEDAFGGVTRQYLISPTEKAPMKDSVWQAGASVVYGSSPVVADQASGLGKPKTPATKPPIEANPETVEAQDENRFIRRMEAVFIQRITSPRKLQKYLRSRTEFFADSQNAALRAWFKWVH